MYFLKQKYEVVETFKVFKYLVENTSGNKIKVIRTKDGNYYVKNNSQHLFHEIGIQMWHYVPYAPQQNGVAEHKNRALKEMETSMMEAKDLSPKLWDEAINCASYVQNISPHKALEGKTLFEAWSGHKPNVSHFRVFHSKAWDRKTRSKFHNALYTRDSNILDRCFIRYDTNSYE